MKRNKAISISQLEPMAVLSFNKGDKEAAIDFDGDEVTYSGDLPVDESAKLFFEAVFQRLKPRCKTCRWYGGDVHNDLKHSCTCPKILYGYGHHYRNEGEMIDSDELSVEDDEGWGMLPGPDFGCIHHEEESDG